MRTAVACAAVFVTAVYSRSGESRLNFRLLARPEGSLLSLALACFELAHMRELVSSPRSHAHATRRPSEATMCIERPA